MSGTDLIDRAKEKLGSDYAVSKALGVKKQRIGNIRAGTHRMSPWMAGKLAEIVGDDPMDAVFKAHQANAPNPQEKKDWRRWSGAAVLMLGIGLICAFDSQSVGYVAALPLFPLYIMTSLGLAMMVVAWHTIRPINT